METRLRIAFVKDWHDDLEHIGGNSDGILAAVAELSKRHSVLLVTRDTGLANRTIINGINYANLAPGEYEAVLNNSDAIVCWGSLDRPWHGTLPEGIPAILCFAGGPTSHPFLRNFDHVLVESRVYEEAFSRHITRVSRAFGTNTDIFRPEARTTKVFDAIYPASFCFHKNIELFAKAMGGRGLAVGNWNEETIVSKCLQLGLPIMRRVSSAALCDLYNMSRCTVVPCGPDGGAQRVVLESMACGIPVVLANDNDKCREFVEESGFGKLVHPVDSDIREAVDALIREPLDPKIGRDYIISKWTHIHYADAIERAARECLSN